MLGDASNARSGGEGACVALLPNFVHCHSHPGRHPTSCHRDVPNAVSRVVGPEKLLVASNVFPPGCRILDNRPWGRTGDIVFEQRLLREFAARLDNDTKSEHADLDEDLDLAWDVALLQAAMGIISDTGAASTDDLCPHQDTDGRDRCKIVAYSIDEEDNRLLLFTSLYFPYDPQQDIPDIPKAEVVKWTSWAARFFRLAVKKDTVRFPIGSQAHAAAQEIRRKLASIDDVLVTFITNAAVRDRAIDSLEEIGKPISFDVWDLERLQRAGDDAVTRDLIHVDFKAIMGQPLPVLEMQSSAAEYRTFLTIIPGETLYLLYEDYGAKLFEFNVRSFLQATGKVNKGIRATLTNEAEKGRFLAYNNGITATADEIDVGMEHGRTVIRSLTGLQIVNGAQTTASIHRARKQDRVDLSGVAVAMKLTRVRPEKLAEFVPLISRFANTQNPIQLADLSANSPFHVRLEQIAEKVWCPGEESRWFYERTRGAYQVARNRAGSTRTKRAEFDGECPKAQRFGKTELAKAWMSWWGLPHVVGRGSQKNYIAFMAELERRKGPGWEPDDDFLRETSALLLLMDAAQKACRKAALGSYMANVAAAMVARLAKDYGASLEVLGIWDKQKVSDELKAVFLEWAPVIHLTLRTAAGLENVTEYAKKEGSWDAIQKANLTWPGAGVPETQPMTAAEPEPVSPAVSSAVEQPIAVLSEDERQIAQCIQLNGAEWGKVIAWAAGSRMVTDYDTRIATTVLQYALQGWLKKPSPKQAKRATRVLNAAQRAGLNWQDAA